ncbi:MAG: hypothetical protein KKC05_00005, partial [Nanoarchaeota archaeon]|nr:hypothetical protein [Nanoarchaeota archaeon]
KNQIKTIGDLAKFNQEKLRELIGEKKGILLHNRANGIDDDPVVGKDKQQLSNLKTLKEDTRDLEIIKPLLHDLALKLAERVKERRVKFKTVSVIVINPEIRTKTRSKTFEVPASDADMMESICLELLQEFLEENPDETIRRIGIGVANFLEKTGKPKKKQPDLRKFFG